VFDLFAAWSVGGCVCCPSLVQRMTPASYIREAGLTVWFSVPSAAELMRQTRALEPGAFPSLRWSLFCGEALTALAAQAWRAAAPSAPLDNLYGPTEVTLACTVYRWDDTHSPPRCVDGVVPIGDPLDGMTARVVDADRRPVPDGTAGELLMVGPQVAAGYWRAPAQTHASFVACAEGPGYLPGDRVVRPSAHAPLAYLGRVDHQIKLHGHRVEPGEIESAIRDTGVASRALVMGLPAGAPTAHELVAFVEAESLDEAAVRSRLAECLPVYMLPRRFVAVGAFPQNANGKVDRAALLGLLAGEGG